MKNLTSISKFISLVLRHKPETISLKLDEHGWADCAELVTKMNQYDRRFEVTEEVLQKIVQEDKKQRYHMWNGRIRANQGHSVEVDLELTELHPPELLFHGTSDNNMRSIRVVGLLKMKRQYVHLSADRETAMVVAKRRADPTVLTISAGKMHRDGHKFYMSKNGVWLTEQVSPVYINKLNASDCG